MRVADRPMTPKGNASGKELNTSNKMPPAEATDNSSLPNFVILGEETRLLSAEGAADCHDCSHDLSRLCPTTLPSSTLFKQGFVTEGFATEGFATSHLATAGLVVNRELKPIANPNYTG